MRKYYNTKTEETKEHPGLMCVPCADKRMHQGSTLLQKKKKEFDERLEMIQEKFDELDVPQDASECNGCSKDYPFDLKHLLTKIVEKHEIPVAKRIVAYILEWDHDNPLEKTESVSRILDKARHLEEIAKCMLCGV